MKEPKKAVKKTVKKTIKTANICKKCKTKLPLDVKVCYNCGTKVK